MSTWAPVILALCVAAFVVWGLWKVAKKNDKVGFFIIGCAAILVGVVRIIADGFGLGR